MRWGGGSLEYVCECVFACVRLVGLRGRGKKIYGGCGVKFWMGG